MPGPKTSREFSVGKVPPASLLRAVYPYLGLRSGRLLIGPGIGRDVAAISYGKRVLVFSTDPITGTTTRIGRHSVHINANDIATAGARPRWYLCTVLLPPKTSEESLQHIMQDIDKAARSLGISVAGGHTEVTPILKHPIVAGFMVGETNKKRLVSAQGGLEGDSILLTKSAGLEGTAILASEQATKLRRLSPSILEGARGFSGHISVVKEALAACKASGVHAMHDPTEGGVLNGLWELSEASNLGIRANADRIPVAVETEAVCKSLGLDPLKLMSSGSLLVAVDPTRVQPVTKVLRRTGVRVSAVGSLVARSRGKRLAQGSKEKRLEAVPTDELYMLA